METSNRDIEVSDDYILLQSLLEHYGITVKQLAHTIGKSASTVYKYCAGELTIPSVVWRTLFRQTKDVRILDLFVENSVMIIPMPKCKRSADIKQLIAARQSQIDCEKYVLQIFADGKVDATDNDVIAKYRQAFPQAMQDAYELYQSVTTKGIL